MSDSLQIHAEACAGWRDPAGDFAGCSCHVDHAAELLADRDQLRDQLTDLQRQLASERHQNTELRASKHELRHTQDLLLRHLTQPSRFRLYIQPRLIPADGGLRIILPNGDEVGFVAERILGGYIATAHDAGWAVPFPTQAMAVDWLTELAQYAAWADLQQGAAAQVEEE